MPVDLQYDGNRPNTSVLRTRGGKVRGQYPLRPINSLQGSEKFLSGLGSRILDTFTTKASRVPVPVLYYTQAIYDMVPGPGEASYSSRLGFGNIRSHDAIDLAEVVGY